MNNFKGSAFWVFSFMKRNKFVMYAVSSVGQKLHDYWVVKMESFVTFITQVKDSYSLQLIGNMVVVPITFDMPSKFTVEQKGSTDVRVMTTGAEKSRFTVFLCRWIKAPGLCHLPKKYNSFRFVSIEYHRIANEKSCMTSSETQLWHNKVWMKREMSFFDRKSLLMLDFFFFLPSKYFTVDWDLWQGAPSCTKWICYPEDLSTPNRKQPVYKMKSSLPGQRVNILKLSPMISWCTSNYIIRAMFNKHNSFSQDNFQSLIHRKKSHFQVNHTECWIWLTPLISLLNLNVVQKRLLCRNSSK